MNHFTIFQLNAFVIEYYYHTLLVSQYFITPRISVHTPNPPVDEASQPEQNASDDSLYWSKVGLLNQETKVKYSNHKNSG